MRALVLSGGAARGAYEAGLIEALAETAPFDIICGSSIGAVNGLLLAQDRPDLLRSFWSSIATRRVLRFARAVAPLATLAGDLAATNRGPFTKRLAAASRLPGDVLGLPASTRLPRTLGLYDLDPVRELIASFADLDTLRRTFIVTVTNLSAGTPESFDAFRGDDAEARRSAFTSSETTTHPLTAQNVVDVLSASIALPMAFRPVTIQRSDGTEAVFGDGGIANNAPIRQAIDAGATHVTVVLLQHSALRYRDHQIKHLGQLAFLMHDVTQERILELDLKLARTVNDAVLNGHARRGKRFVDLRVIGPSVPLRLGALRFDDQSAIDRVYELGLADGRVAAAYTG